MQCWGSKITRFTAQTTKRLAGDDEIPPQKGQIDELEQPIHHDGGTYEQVHDSIGAPNAEKGRLGRRGW
jgi:hypothetical protein